MADTLADAVIVGGGILGMSLAYELARRTLRVTLLESHALANGASGNGFAWINATSKDEDEAYHQLNAESVAAYDALALEWGAEQIGLNGGGSLHWTNPEDADATEKLKKRFATLQVWAAPVALLSGREMRTLEPRIPFSDDALGLFAPSDRWLDVPRYVRFLAGEFQKRRGIIRQYSPALGFTLGITRKINSVQTVDGTISTPILILAAGLQTPLLLQKLTQDVESLRCVPVHADAGLLIETPSNTKNSAIRRVLYPPDSNGLHLRPTVGGGLLFGADDGDRAAQALTPEQAMSGGNLPQEISAALYDRVNRVSSALFQRGDASRYVSRICFRPMPADQLPIAGAIPGIHGVFTLVSHSGVTLAPALSQALADEICNIRQPEELRPYSPQRFLSL